MRTLVSLLPVALAFAMAGCVSLPRQDLRLNASASQVQDDLFTLVREHVSECVVSEKAHGLVVEYPTYQGRKSGLFGLGPTWQERLLIDIAVVPDSDGTTTVTSSPLIYERQNDGFEWVRIAESERADAKIRRLFLHIQELRYRYGR